MTVRLLGAVIVLLAVGAGGTADLRLIHAVMGDGDQPGIVDSVEAIRGQAFDSVPVPVRAPATLRDVLADVAVAEVIDDRTLAARGRAWRAIGLGDERTPQRLWRLLARDVPRVAFDEESRQLYVDPSVLTPRDFAPNVDEEATTVLQMTGVRPDEPLIAHVLVHALQNQRGDTPRLARTTDELLSVAAMREAEANLVAVYMRFRNLGIAGEMLKEGITPDVLRIADLLPPEIDDAPAIDRRLAEFVYLQGLTVATGQLQQGGWGAVDVLRSRRSTLSWITPESAEKEEPAPAIDIPPAPAAPAEGFRPVDSDTLGPVAIGAVLAQGGMTERSVERLIVYWRGDRLSRFVSETGKGSHTHWESRWADSASAEAFIAGLQETLDQRFSTGEGTAVDGVVQLTADDASYRLRRVEGRVLVDVRTP
ncbi:MAG: hypothetical protein OEV00_05530 [Acidobacteriota bacterium]|nr:hypothetical protein [Acidobacteriota bacterium]MDH3784775.1 hypothetical protein [Acidobacteriota bacterium]